MAPIIKGILAGELVVITALFLVIGSAGPQPEAGNWAFGFSLILAPPAAILLGVVLIATRVMTRWTSAGLLPFAALSAALAGAALPLLGLLSAVKDANGHAIDNLGFPVVFIGGGVVLAVAGGIGGLIAGKSYGYR